MFTAARVSASRSIPPFVLNDDRRREHLFSRDTNKNANKPDGCGEFLRVLSTRHENFAMDPGGRSRRRAYGYAGRRAPQAATCFFRTFRHAHSQQETGQSDTMPLER
jgi:hypothetical protein